MRFDRHVATGQTRSTGRKDDVDLWVFAPVTQDTRYLAAIVAHDGSTRNAVPGGLNASRQRVTRPIVVRCSSV